MADQTKTALRATGARQIAERITQDLIHCGIILSEEHTRSMEQTIAACQSAAPSPEQLSNAWRRYQELFGAAPHGTVKQMGALLALIPAHAGGERAACPYWWEREAIDAPEPPQGAGEPHKCITCGKPIEHDQVFIQHPETLAYEHRECAGSATPWLASAPDETRAGTDFAELERHAKGWLLRERRDYHPHTMALFGQYVLQKFGAQPAAAPSEAVRAALVELVAATRAVITHEVAAEKRLREEFEVSGPDLPWMDSLRKAVARAEKALKGDKP